MAQKGRYVYDWPRPMVTVDAAVAILEAGRIRFLLIKRGNEPYKGTWALPGGFVEMDEELEDAAARELQEETGLTGIKLEQMQTYGTIGRDPRGRQISVVFLGIAQPQHEKSIRPGDDADEADWFDAEALPRMAFDHAEIAATAAKRLKAIKQKTQDDAQKIQELTWGCREAHILQAANRLGIFNALAQGAKTTGQICDTCRTKPQMTEKILIACAAMGLLEKKNGCYYNTPLADTYLVAGRRLYQGDIIEHSARAGDLLMSNIEQQAWVRQPCIDEQQATHRAFIMGMHNLSMTGRTDNFAEIIDLSGRKKMLDVGGGPGSYSIAACRKWPGLSAVIFDLPETIAIAREVIAAEKMQDRITFCEGNWEEDEFGDGFDVVLMSNILHGQNSMAEMKLGKAYQAMVGGGMLVIQDFVLNNAKNGPVIPAIFNVMVGAYSKEKLLGLIKEAGFENGYAAAEYLQYGGTWLVAGKR